MKHIFPVIIFCSCLSLSANAQKPTKQEARQFFDQAISSLKNSDLASFSNLWYLSNDLLLHPEKAFTADNVQANYEEMKVFLDTVLTLNLEIDKIEIEKESYLDKIAKSSDYCYIKMWFKYNKHYFKGIGFNVIWVKDKWLCCFQPDYSTLKVPE